MNTSKLIRTWRFGRLFLHLVLGILEVAVLFPWRSSERNIRAIASWSRRTCAILNIHIEVVGKAPGASVQGSMLAANHISWVDIFVLNSATVSRFVAKAEVRSWPLIGWLCAYTGTLFVTRERRQDTRRVNKEICAALAQGDCVAVFPEGTTTDGFDVIPFNASLLQPAVDAGAGITPVALRYYDSEGKRSDAPAYIGEMSLLDSIVQIINQKKIVAKLDFLPEVSTVGGHRRELAREIQSQISAVVLADSPIAALSRHTQAVVEHSQ